MYFEGVPDPVAGLSKVSGLKRTTEVVEHRNGGDPSTEGKSPGRTKYEAITLERGVTQDPDFEIWASKVWTSNALGGEGNLEDFRRELTLVLMNEAGQPVVRYFIHRCWVSEYQALPDLDANAIALQHIKVENEGWERDIALVELVEP